MEKKILIADNNEDSLRFYHCALPNDICITTMDGNEAIEKFIKEKPDLVILNCRIKNMDGFEVAKEIRALNKLIKIIMISSSTEVEVKALTSGCDEFYLKPISAKQLRELTV